MFEPIETDTMVADDQCRSVKTIDEGVWRIADQVHRRKRTYQKPWKMKAVKQVSIAVLLATAVFWIYAGEFHLVTRSLVALGAVAVTFQAMNSRSNGFAILFAGMALLYNPIVPLFVLSGPVSLAIVLASTIPFATSLLWTKTTLAERDRMSGTEGI